jgi:hypothetical protein
MQSWNGSCSSPLNLRPPGLPKRSGATRPPREPLLRPARLRVLSVLQHCEQRRLALAVLGGLQHCRKCHGSPQAVPAVRMAGECNAIVSLPATVAESQDLSRPPTFIQKHSGTDVQVKKLKLLRAVPRHVTDLANKVLKKSSCLQQRGSHVHSPCSCPNDWQTYEVDPGTTLAQVRDVNSWEVGRPPTTDRTISSPG